jgi:hypothetical protein
MAADHLGKPDLRIAPGRGKSWLTTPKQDLSMRMLASALTLAAALSLAPLAPALAETVPGSEFKIGNWEGSAQTDPTGAFSHCTVSVGYTTDQLLWLGLYANDTLAVLLSDPNVRFRPGETFDSWLVLEVDLPIKGVSEAWDESFAGLTLEGIDASIAFLAQGQSLRLLGIGIDNPLDITGISEALALARDCHAQQTGGTAPAKAPPPPKVPDLKPKTGSAGGLGTGGGLGGGGLGTRPGGALGTPAPKPAP